MLEVLIGVVIVALIVTERLEMRRARNLVEDSAVPQSWNFDLGAEFACEIFQLFTSTMF